MARQLLDRPHRERALILAAKARCDSRTATRWLTNPKSCSPEVAARLAKAAAEQDATERFAKAIDRVEALVESNALSLLAAKQANATVKRSKPSPAISFHRDPPKRSSRLVAKAVGLAALNPDAQGDLRLVTGIVLEPDVVDSQGDTYSADEIRKTAHLWMLEFQNIGLQHAKMVNDAASPVESWIAPVDTEIGGQAVKAGTWLLTVKVFDDSLWSAVKAGKLTGFSIGGFANREEIND